MRIRALALAPLLLAAALFPAAPALRAAEAPAPGKAAPADAGDWKTTPESAPGATDDAWRGKTVVIPLEGPIGPRKLGGNEEPFIEAVKKAGTAKRVVVAIDSPGGLVESCDHICQALLRCPAPTVALVRHKAVSGGAMVATACREIHMLAGSRIGDVQPMSFSGGRMDERTAEKIEADVRAMMAVNAERNGYPKVLLEAMVTRNYEVYEVRFADGRREFMDAPAYRLFEENQKAGRDHRELAAPPKLVVGKGQLLAIDAATAVSLGIARRQTASEWEFLRALGAAPEDVVRVELPAVDGLSLFGDIDLSRGAIVALVIFLVIGVAGTLTEMHAPGFGLPGAAGIIGFTCFFYILFSHGRAEWYEIVLFVMGVIFMVLEIVVLPGFGVCGVLGGIFLLAGLVLALLPDLSSDYMRANWWPETSFALILALGVLVGGGLLFIFLVNRAGKLPLGRQAFLEDTLPDYATAMHEADAAAPRGAAPAPAPGLPPVGAAATAATDLRPAGKIVMADGRELDAVSAGEFIAKGAAVVVSAVAEDHPVVRRAPGAAPRA